VVASVKDFMISCLLLNGGCTTLFVTGMYYKSFIFSEFHTDGIAPYEGFVPPVVFTGYPYLLVPPDSGD
jgi:hypothetical protein